MSVNAINQSVVPQQPQKKTGGAGKAWCSVFIPGLGQFLDDRNAAGAAYMGGNIALSVGLIALSISCRNSMTKTKLAACLASSLAASALWIANIVDAYKGKKQNPQPQQSIDTQA